MKIIYITSFTGKMLCKILARLKHEKVPVQYEVYSDKDTICKKLQNKHPNMTVDEIFTQASGDLIILGGFMRIVPDKYVQKFKGKLINYHPSYLPDLPGKDPQKRALIEYRKGYRKYTGGTVHYVDEGIDTGEIIIQAKYFFKGDENDCILFNRLDTIGADLLTQVIKWSMPSSQQSII